MANAQEFECTGSYEEVLSRLRLALNKRYLIAGRVEFGDAPSTAKFSIHEYKPWGRAIRARARGEIRQLDGRCVASYRIGNIAAHALSIVTLFCALSIGVVLWIDPATRNLLALLAGAVPLLIGIGYVELVLLRSSRRLHRLVIEHLKG